MKKLVTRLNIHYFKFFEASFYKHFNPRTYFLQNPVMVNIEISKEEKKSIFENDFCLTFRQE